MPTKERLAKMREKKKRDEAFAVLPEHLVGADLSLNEAAEVLGIYTGGLVVPIPRDFATQPTVILPLIPRASCRVSRSEATQGFQVKVLPCLLSIFLFPCAWFFRSS